MLHLPIAQFALRMDLLVQRQAATTDRQRSAQQMQRLVLLQITPIDDDQRLGHAGEQHPRQGSVDAFGIGLQMLVAQQPVRPFDAMAQRAATAKTSTDLGQRQPWPTDRCRNGFQQSGQTAPVDTRQQRRDTTL
jgi:hypothetical protein